MERCPRCRKTVDKLFPTPGEGYSLCGSCNAIFELADSLKARGFTEYEITGIVDTAQRHRENGEHER